MTTKKIAVVGESESVCIFGALKIDTFVPQNQQQTQEIIARLAKEDYGLIFVSEDKIEEVSDLIAEFRARAYPIILPLPSVVGSKGLGFEGIKHNMEIAVGMDLIFDKEEQ